MEWWLQTEAELQEDPVARHNRQVAFVNVLYTTEEGKHVLNAIRELCYATNNIELISLYCNIRNIAGRTRLTEHAMIAAEAAAIVIEPVTEEGEE